MATFHTHPANSTAESGKKINPLSRVEKNKSATNPITCWRANPDIFESDDVKSVSSLSPKNKPIWRHNVSGEQGKFPATISLYGRMLWRHFSAEEPWVLEWIRIPSGTCGRANSIWIRYVWTAKFLNLGKLKPRSNANRIEWSPIQSVIIRVIAKSDDRAVGVRFVCRLTESRSFITNYS